MENIVVAYGSSLRGIRAARRRDSFLSWEPLGKVEQRRVLASCNPRHGVDFDHLQISGFWGGLPTERCDVLVDRKDHMSQRASVATHLLSRPLPPGALMHVSQNLYACSPEFTALLYSCGRTVPEILALLMELLGTYTLPEEATLPIAWGGMYPDATEDDDVQQVHYRCEPVATIKRLRAMADWAKSSAYTAFRQAVRYAAEGSASPAETVMYGVFGLPMSYGGFNVAGLKGGILLNYRLNFTESASRMASGMPYAICDAYIPAAHADLEYNGLLHELPESRLHDGRRNNGLRGMGVKVIVIDRGQMRDIGALEAIAQSIYRDAGARFRYRITGYRQRQRALLNDLRQATGLRRI